MTALRKATQPAWNELPEWGISPSPSDWQVLLYGGDKPPLAFQFFKRRRENGAGYDRDGIVRRAEDMAEQQHRTRFAVRDTDGAVVYIGICRMWEPLSEGSFLSLVKGHRQFGRAGL